MKFRQHPTYGFTTKATGLRNALENQILISEVYDPATGLPEPVKRQYVAIWDTGATNTVVTRKVAQELNLRPSGRVSVQAVGAGDQVHEYETDTYLLNIHLPNNVVIFGIRVSEGTIGGADVLLGMDIIAQVTLQLQITTAKHGGHSECLQMNQLTLLKKSNSIKESMGHIAFH